MSIAADGAWAVMADYGGAQDIGEDFEIALIVVDEQVNILLQQWVQKREEINKYPHTMGTDRIPPLAFPDAIAGCPPVNMTVKKTSHD